MNINVICDKTIESLDNYIQDYRTKTELFIKRLAELGLNVVVSIVSLDSFTGQTENNTKIEPLIRARGHAWVLTTTSSGILYLEFGSGIRNVGRQNPKAAEHGMGPGTNSPKGHWADPGGWWFPTDDARLIKFYDKSGQGYGHTYGVTPTMPFYNAEKQIIYHVESIAKEIWK